MTDKNLTPPRRCIARRGPIPSLLSRWAMRHAPC